MPRPRPPIVNSPTTAPVTDSAMPARMPASTLGSAIGDSTHTSDCHHEAPSRRAASSTSRGRARTPSTVVMSIGKNATTAQRIAMGVSP